VNIDVKDKMKVYENSKNKRIDPRKERSG